MSGDRFVCARIEAVSASVGIRQFRHDTREECPPYLKGPSDVLVNDRWGCFKNRRIQGRRAVEGIRRLFWEIEKVKEEQRMDYREFHGKRLPGNTRPFARAVLVFSREVDQVPLNTLYEAAEELFLRLASETNMPFIYLAMHMDEKRVHFHCLLQNYDYESHKTVIRSLDRGFFSKLQDLAEEIFSHLGFRRGIPKKLTGDANRSVTQAHKEECVLREAERIVFRNLQRDLRRSGILETLGRIDSIESKEAGEGEDKK